ncbi:NUDIX domain-containing protein [Flammeovirgaceae bacterium SG7u.111]|nr:NUDIX domain-containing protein [Flammeovirgaceae bacterium SG7u.132]WPO37849.1 NUDIX domain-containing protein [Flammeovirgaceae bacterium SG7u.111]
MHQGVGLLIGNKERELFFIQKKDAGYQLPKWVGAYAFWGGKIEENDPSPFDALLRELSEEIVVDLDKNKIQFVNQFLVQSDKEYSFHLYELLLTDEELTSLSTATILEGECELVSKKNLLQKPWIWGLEKVIDAYFSTHV